MAKEETVAAITEIKLSSPLAGKDTLKLDFDKLNGYTLQKCYNAAKREEPNMAVAAFSMAYQVNVAAIAAGVKYDDIMALKGKDFTAVTLLVQGFLLNTGT